MEPVAVDVVDAAIKERKISEEVLVEWKEASDAIMIDGRIHWLIKRENGSRH